MTSSLMAWKIPAGEKYSLLPLELPYQLTSLDLTSNELPMGVYTTFRTFGDQRALCLENHFSRLEESARLIGKPVQLARSTLRQGLREALSLFAREARIRLTVDLEDEPGAVYITLEPLRLLPQQAYEVGVRVVTRRLQRSNPRAKVSRFIRKADRLRRNLPEGVEEIIMVDEQGKLLEGLSSNFFVVEKGEIWTAEKGVLAGITRSLVLEAATLLGIKVHSEARTLANLPEANEAFITSSTRAVLPVTRVDEMVIGSDVPGPITRSIAAKYQVEVEKRLELI